MITSPIIKVEDQVYPNAGTIKATVLVNSEMHTIVLDYGNGANDNLATITIDGGTPMVETLPEKFWGQYLQ